MSKKYILLVALLCSAALSAQVKIGGNDGIPNADAMLEIESTNKGVLFPRLALTSLSSEAPLSNHVEGMIVYNTTVDAAENLTSGLYQNDGTRWKRLIAEGDENTTIYSAENDGAWSLLGLSIGGNNWSVANLNASDTKLGNSALFNNGVYTVPEDGIYSINYEIQLEGGVDLGVLGGRRIGLVKNNTIMESKLVDAVRVSLLGITLASVPVTSTSLNTLQSFQAGDELSFGIQGTILDLGLLTDGKITIYIYKISD